MAQRKTQKKKLEEELSALIPQLDEEGLSFLIRQANVHLYNMQVDRLNAEMEKSVRPKPASAGVKKAKGKAAGASATKKEGAKALSAGGQPSFSIKHSPSAACYHIGFAGGWKLFTEGEMDKLVRLAKSRQSASEVRRACFAWLKAERLDALSEWGISSAEDETLKELISFLNSKFGIRRS